jgi:hypothetical protein
VGPIVLGGPVFWRLAEARRVLHFLKDFADGAPDELGVTLTLRLAPPSPFLPPEQYGKPVLGLVLVWAGNPQDGERALRPLREIGTPLADVVRPVPYVALQCMLDGGAPHGVHYYWKSHRLPRLGDDVIDLLIGRVECITSPLSQIGGWVVGGAVSRVAPDATAVGERGSGLELNLVSAWRPSDQDGSRHLAWVRDGWDALRPQASGVYANFLSDEGEAGVAAAYGERLGRLTALKDRLDPSNAFRMNANIPPSGWPGRVVRPGAGGASAALTGREA